MGFLDRLFSRQAKPQGQRMLEATSGKRWTSTPPFGSMAAEVAGGAARVRGRARHLRHNDPLAANAAAIYKTGLVGYGATAASQHPDASTRSRIDERIAAWAAKTRFAEIQTEIVDALVTDGEAIVVMRVDEAGELRLQHVPAEQLDESMTIELAGGGYIANGVEFNTSDEIVAYHIFKTRLTDVFPSSQTPIRVPAEDVLHIFKREGAGQHRGLSWFAPVVLPLNELSQLQDALLVSAKIQAMMCGFVQDLNGTGTAFAEGQQSGGIMDLSLEPGTMRVLPSGYSVTFSNPAQMQQSVDFASHSIRLIAAGLQVPEFLLSGDMRNVNYSSARTALVQFRQHLEAIQFTLLVSKLFVPVYRRWLALADLNGSLEIGDDDGAAVEWFFPAMPWVDPKKDADGTAAMIAAGLMSRKQAVAALGFNIEKLDAEIAADRKRENALGLSFEQSPALAAESDKKEEKNDAEDDE
ncbi:phage portal protein [Sinorhizobium fredii]|uniref:phage portal protein n=1 Tax=Rhizobium fredii TaxID=380 RepID=UPI0030A28579